MDRVVVLAAGAAALLLAGCANRSVVPLAPGDRAPAHRSTLVLGVGARTKAERATLVRMRDELTAFEVEFGGLGARAFALPPGRYCVASVTSEGRTYRFEVQDQRDCPIVRYARSVYAGHLEVVSEKYLRWERRIDDTCAVLRRHDPDVLIRLAADDREFTPCLTAPEPTDASDYDPSPVRG